MTDRLPTTQEELDRLIAARLARATNTDWKAAARQWEKRCKRANNDVDTWRREARRWEALAKENLTVIRAHEATIAKFIDKLDDVLSEDPE